MEFLEKMDLVKTRLQKPLPGTIAHKKMAPKHRTILGTKISPKAKESAVLILFYLKKAEIYTVLMQRPRYKGAHSAQISFPGGKKEPVDRSLEETALREAKEELGIPMEKVQIMGTLSNVYVPPSKCLVTPHIGYIEEEIEFIPDSKEVEEIIEASVDTLLEEKTVNKAKVPVLGGLKITVPCFKINDNVIWGATAMMISELKELML